MQAVAAGLTASSGPASKAMNGIKVAYHQSGLIKGPGGVGAHKFTSSLVTTQQPDRYVSESDMFRSKVSLMSLSPSLCWTLKASLSKVHSLMESFCCFFLLFF